MPLKFGNTKTTLVGYDADTAKAFAAGNTREDAIEFAASQPKAQRISTEWPIYALGFMLTGDTAATAAAEAISPLGPFALINNLRVAMNGTNQRIVCRGHQLPYIHRMHAGGPGYVELPQGAGWDQGFAAYAEIPIDVGSYRSPLDASGKTLEVQVDWAAASAAFANIDLSNVRLQVIPRVLSGGKPGQVGGKEAGGVTYLDRRIFSSSYDVVAAREDFRIPLTAGRNYDALTLLAFSDGVLVDSIVDEVRIIRSGDNKVHLTNKEVRAMNWKSYNLSSSEPWTGVYDIPFVRGDYMEDVLVIDDSQAMRVECKVKSPGTVDRIEVIESFVQKRDQTGNN